MSIKKVKKEEMKQVKGGFDPLFSVSEEGGGRVSFHTFAMCDDVPPPNTAQMCIAPLNLSEKCKW